jgi:transporter family protein
VATGGSWLCYCRALKIGQAAQVAPIDKLSVVLVAAFATALLGERLSVRISSMSSGAYSRWPRGALDF